MRIHEDAKVQKWVGERRGRPFAVVKAGEEFFHEGDRWVHRYRNIDRLANRYDEVITDPETGQVLREVHEPLTDHQDRGSARRDRPRS